jgi:hypothetical protein
LILYAIDSESNDVFPDVGRLEVVEIGWRSRWSNDEKERIVGEAFAIGSSVRSQPASQQLPFLVSLRPYDRASGNERVVGVQQAPGVHPMTLAATAALSPLRGVMINGG